MGGLSIPDDFPLLALVGQEVTQVCIGLSQVQLHFYQPISGSAFQRRWEPGASVCVEAGYELQMPGADAHLVRHDLLAKQGGQLTGLLGDTVAAVSQIDQNELVIQFTSNARLRLLTDQSGFESYHLHIAGETVDVTKP